MGKYMRKAKITGEVALMEVSHQSTLGVRTRAKTLALQRLQTDQSTSYLQLRNRRLIKSPRPASPRAKETCEGGSFTVLDTNPNGQTSKGENPNCGNKWKMGSLTGDDGGVEVSLGENVLEVESTDRDMRETTPCSLLRHSDPVRTPGSATRPSNSNATNRRTKNAELRNIPTTHEMEEFFTGAEQHQQIDFVEKYNYDPVNDCPLPGRYEWVRLNLRS